MLWSALAARVQHVTDCCRGALKLKEISYVHAEGLPAAEMKHGHIALIDSMMPVVVIAPHDDIYEKVFSNVQEVLARGGRLIVVTNESNHDFDEKWGTAGHRG